MTREILLELLKKVKDPLTGQSLILANRIQNISVENKKVSISLAYGAKLDSRLKSELHTAIVEIIADSDPGLDIDIHYSNLEQTAKKVSKLPQIQNIIAVASGKGGVGKSTVSVNLALGLKAQGYKVGLLDADLYGPSIPIMMGLRGARPKVEQVYGVSKIVPLQAFGIPVMSIGFVVEPEQAVVLRGPRLAGIMKQFLEDCLWPELDILIIDLPPGTGDIQLTLVQTVPVTGAVIVTTPQAVAVSDAIKAANMFLMSGIEVPILGIVENMAWFSPKELPDHKYKIFGEGGGEKLASFCESKVIGQIPLIMGIRESGDQGTPAVLAQDDPEMVTYLKEMAENCMSQLKARVQNLPPTEQVKMKV